MAQFVKRGKLEVYRWGISSVVCFTPLCKADLTLAQIYQHWPCKEVEKVLSNEEHVNSYVKKLAHDVSKVGHDCTNYRTQIEIEIS